jgi:hypothetical protein
LNPKQTRISLLTIILMIALLGIVIIPFDLSPIVVGSIFVVLALIALMLWRRNAPRGSNRLLIGLTLLSIAAV